MIVCIVGRSGSGKTALAKAMQRYGFNRTVSYTTREPREGEKNGIEYNFVRTKEFFNLLQSNALAECTSYGNNLYGTPHITEGVDCTIVVDTAGYLFYKSKFPDDVIGVYLDIPQSVAEQRMSPGQLLRARRYDCAEIDNRLFNIVIDAMQPNHVVLSNVIQKLEIRQHCSAM